MERYVQPRGDCYVQQLIWPLRCKQNWGTERKELRWAGYAAQCPLENWKER
jgi:hypothetical protein